MHMTLADMVSVILSLFWMVFVFALYLFICNPSRSTRALAWLLLVIALCLLGVSFSTSLRGKL